MIFSAVILFLFFCLADLVCPMAKLTKYRPNNSAILAKRGDGQVIYDNAAFQQDNRIQVQDLGNLTEHCKWHGLILCHEREAESTEPSSHVYK